VCNFIIEGHELDRFKLLREEIRFEYNLTSSRVSWYVASQAFLVSSFAISIGGQSSSKLKWFWQTIPIIGILSSLLVLLPVFVCFVRIIDHQKDIDKIISHNDKCRKQLPFKQIRWRWRWLAASYAALTPLIFLFAWIFICYKSNQL
jgi:hypothetical protein